MLATVLSRALSGMQAPAIFIESHLLGGIPSFSVVGLPETAVKESRDRVRSAITSCRFEFPAGRVVLGLAPADLPKSGGGFDLPIALAILAASDQIPAEVIGSCEFVGELSLSGAIKGVRGVLPAVIEATKAGHRIVVPADNLAEASLVQGAKVAGAAHLLEVCAHVRGSRPLPFALFSGAPSQPLQHVYPDLADVRGQPAGRRALEIAAAGSHHLLMVGAPGTGKSMLAQRLPGILPPLTPQQAMESAAIASLSPSGFRVGDWGKTSMRSPHHTTPALALVGGGAHPKPGELSLAHHGVLFLDEISELNRMALEALREPLETGVVCVSRTAHKTEFPARALLVAAMNPCACSGLGEGQHCRCTESQLRQYRQRLSGPLLDRFDMHVRLARVNVEHLSPSAARPESSATVAERVRQARHRQMERQGLCNAHLDNAGIERYCESTPEALRIVEKAMRRFALSARAYHKILKVGRTIADLENAGIISDAHVTEAIMFRQYEWNAVASFTANPRSYEAEPIAAVAERAFSTIR